VQEELYDRGLASGAMVIRAEEPYIPWELLIPTRKSPDGNIEVQPLPLGVQFAIGRWCSADFRPNSQKLRMDKVYVIAPPSASAPLKKQKAETDYVCSRFESKLITPVTVKSIENQMKAEPRDVLHWCCHGSSEDAKAGRQVIDLDGGQQLDSLMVTGMDSLRSAVASRSAFIFMNACEVGKEIPGLGGIGGFAQSFMQMGASAIVAPMWRVDDEQAFEVAQEFYNNILDESRPAVAEVLRCIRAKAYNEGPDQGKATFAAYCYYGDPCASVAPAITPYHAPPRPGDAGLLGDKYVTWIEMPFTYKVVNQ
jgi:hypothetical protein